MPQNTGFARRLRETREHRSISASDLARLAKVTPTAVWNWETKGTIPRKGALAALATVLNVNAEWLLTGHGDTESTRVSGLPIDLSSLPLEDLIAAIDRKGFQVNVRPKSS